MSTLTLLGPQTDSPTVGGVLEELGIKGKLGLITCGWEEREELDSGELCAQLPNETHNLRLFARFEEVLERDEPFFQALLDRNDRLRTMQRLYRKRLDHQLNAVWQLHTMSVPRMELLMPERANSVYAVARLDAHYVDRLREIHSAFEDLWNPSERPVLVEIREQIAAETKDCEAILIAGGDVGVLIDRLRLFDMRRVLRRKNVIAWSAGAMSLAEQIVLFHDHPPQGKGNPEIYDDGLGLCPKVVLLPHASARLDLDDRLRVKILASRFAPSTCVTLDPGCGIRWDGEVWTPFGRTRRLTKTGKVLGMLAP